MIETWRDIEEFTSYYVVSNHGRVKNLKTGRILKCGRNRSGSLNVKLSIDGCPYLRQVAQLTAIAFVPNEEGLRVVRFKDGNNQNVFAVNLYWDNKTHDSKRKQEDIFRTELPYHYANRTVGAWKFSKERECLMLHRDEILSMISKEKL